MYIISSKMGETMNFNEFYSKKTSYFSDSHSGGMQECIDKYNVTPCTSLDIGAGEGRNSLYLASRGFTVKAIEPSTVGATKIKERAINNSFDIEVYNTDFLTVSSEISNIGFVVALTSLEHMEYTYLSKTISEIKRVLKIGGYIYIVVFTEEDPGFLKKKNDASECSMFIKHYFKKGELKSFFSDFRILEYKEYTKEDSTHGPIHYHGKAKLFAQKIM